MFSKTNLPGLFAFSLAVNSHFSFRGGHDLLCGPRAPHSQAEASGYAENSHDSRHSTTAFSGTSGGKARRWENKFSPPWLCKEVGKGPACQNRSAPGPAAKQSQWNTTTQQFCRDNIQYGSITSATYRSPNQSPGAALLGPLPNIIRNSAPKGVNMGFCSKPTAPAPYA